MKVTLIVATTADGFIARDSDSGSDWTEPADKEFFREKTIEIGTVIMGANTYRALPGALPDRRAIVMTSTPNAEKEIPGTLEFFSGEPRELLEKLAAEGVTDVALVGGSQLDGSFLVEHLVDEIYLTLSPLMFGQGLNIASGYDLEMQLRLLNSTPIGNDSVLLHYEVINQ